MDDGQQATPTTTAEPMVGGHPVPSDHRSGDAGDPAGGAAQLMRMDDVHTAQRPGQLRSHRVSRMTSQATEPAQHPHTQPVRGAGNVWWNTRRAWSGCLRCAVGSPGSVAGIPERARVQGWKPWPPEARLGSQAGSR
jgi:hypothetical protein